MAVGGIVNYFSDRINQVSVVDIINQLFIAMKLALFAPNSLSGNSPWSAVCLVIADAAAGNIWTL